METVTEAVQEEQVVAFRLDNEQYGVDITSVQEIVQVGGITRVPRAPAYMEGVTNLRGRIVPVINLRVRFGLPAIEPTAETRIIVVALDGAHVGFLVDAVSEVMRIPQAAIEPPSTLITLPDDDLVRGVGKLEHGLICLINLRPLVGGV